MKQLPEKKEFPSAGFYEKTRGDFGFFQDFRAEF
jgi:hypothetical protein